MQIKSNKVMKALNNLSLFAKFALIFVFCVMLPISFSGIRYTVITNRQIEDREYENLENEARRIREEIFQMFATALRNANVVLSDSAVSSMMAKSYEDEEEFYNELLDNGMKGYFDRFTSVNDDFRFMRIFVDNYTVTNSDVFSKLDETAKSSLWYSEMEQGKNLVVAPDFYTGHHGQYDNATISLVKKKLYAAENDAPEGYIKIDMNLSRLARLLDNKNRFMSFYLYNDKYKCYIDPVKKRLLSYEGRSDEAFDGGGTFSIDDKISGGEYLSGWRLRALCDTSDLKRRQRNNVLSTFLICAVFGVIALILVYLIYCSNKRRIELLKTGMNNMVNEKFEKITDETGRDEISEMIYEYNYMTDRMSSLINDVYKLEMKNSSMEAESVKAELKYLQSQINPHFIFNTLSAMQVEALKNGCGVLAEQIYGLARLMRRIIDWTDDYRPLSEELEFIRIYLELEKFRFGDKFAYEIDAREDALRNELPIMIVQPLVENSCRHGLQDKKGQRKVYVGAVQDNGALTVTVWDNGKGIDSETLKKINDDLGNKEFEGHVGIKNVYRRLKLCFGDRAAMNISSAVNEWTRITITIDMKSV